MTTMPIKQEPGYPEIWDFTKYDPVTDNVFGVDVLHQDKEWLTKDKRRLRLEDMTPSHRRNLLEFLRKRAFGLAFKDGIIMLAGPMAPGGDHAMDAAEEAVTWQIDNPQEWLENTPLVKRLKELIEEDDKRPVTDFEVE
jgi:hypothetical protein